MGLKFKAGDIYFYASNEMMDISQVVENEEALESFKEEGRVGDDNDKYYVKVLHNFQDEDDMLDSGRACFSVPDHDINHYRECPKLLKILIGISCD